MDASSLKAGTVLRVVVDFLDGQGPRPKFVVLLNDPADGGALIFAYTTSRGRRYHNESTGRCTPDSSSYRIEEGDPTGFEATTWVQFDNIVQQSSDAFPAWCKTNNAESVEHLDDPMVSAIVNCALKAFDLAAFRQAIIKASADARRQAEKLKKEAAAKKAAGAAISSALRERLWELTDPLHREGVGLERHMLCDLAGDCQLRKLHELTDSEMQQLLNH
jgi:hypothetical protein